MKVILKMAFRNVGLHKKQSFLIGLTLALAIFMIAAISTALNGMEKQVYSNYIKIQSGHVIGIWKDVKEQSNMSPERLLYMSNKQLEGEDNYINQKAARLFRTYVSQHQQQIAAVFYQVRQNVTLKTKEAEDSFTLYSLSEAHGKWMMTHESIELETGELLSPKGICISKEKAQKNSMNLGEEVELTLKDIEGEEKTIKLKVTGIYKNKAQYENYYVFLPEQVAYGLVGYEDSLFDMARIYLKEENEAQSFAKELDQELVAYTGEQLRAEDYHQASVFYTKLYVAMKSIYKVFFIFILGVIAVGLGATVRMNLLTRMEEFGTLRAIGYSRHKCHAIIFFEVFILAFISMCIGLTLVVSLVLLFGETGIYVGSGAATYMVGGESFCPKLEWQDILFCLSAIGAFAVIATLQPSYQLLGLSLTDLLAKHQGKSRKTRVHKKSKKERFC